MSCNIKKERGFTLVELLIVVIILAILAAIVIPQFSGSTEDAKMSSLQSTLSSMRNAVELYYQQHGQRYPGAYKTDGATVAATAADAETAFIAQLTQYTDANGLVSTTKSATYKFGPYLKSTTLPKNPFIADSAKVSAIQADVSTSDITTAPTADGATGWKFYVKIGRFIANDKTTLSDNTTTTVSQ